MKITWIIAMAIVTEKITVVLEELYGKKYSTSQVSRMFDYARRRRKNGWSGLWKVIIPFSILMHSIPLRVEVTAAATTQLLLSFSSNNTFGRISFEVC